VNESTIAIVTGPKEGGKTHTAREIVSMHPRSFAIEWRGQLALDGAVTARGYEEMRLALKANSRGKHWLIIHAPSFDVEAGSELVARCVYEIGDCLAVFDEAHAYMSASSLGPWMGRLIREARHAGNGAGANITICSPRLADISTDARTQADVWIVCGSLWTVRDLDTMEQHTSVEFRRETQEPLRDGEHRQIGFDTRTRKRFEVTREELRRLFRL
jgi:hypothetical protein